MTNIFSSDQNVIIIFLLAAAIALALVVACIILAANKRSRRRKSEALRKEAEQRELDRLNRNIRTVTATLNGFLRGIVDTAVSYGDIVTPERVSDLIDEVQSQLDDIHDYDEIMSILSTARDKAEQIRLDMERHEQELEADLKEEAEGKAAWKKKYPYSDTKFFKSCVDIPSVKHLFRQLAKVYHPDAGGDADTYMKLQSEYQTIVKKAR